MFVRFNAFVWVSVSKELCSYPLGLIILRWSSFLCAWALLLYAFLYSFILPQARLFIKKEKVGFLCLLFFGS